MNIVASSISGGIFVVCRCPQIFQNKLIQDKVNTADSAFIFLMFYPEAPDIWHLWVDVGLQRLWRHPLVRRRLVAPAPVLGHLRTMMITIMMMLMMAIVDLVRVISSLRWRGWCYHGHGQAEVSNLVIRTVIIICWWSDFEKNIFYCAWI